MTDAGLGPICDVDETEIIFDLPVMVGSSPSRKFTITNAGQGVLVGSVSEAGPSDHFHIFSGEGAFALEAGETHDVWVEYEPLSAGEHSCTVRTGTYLCGDVSVYGTAFECPPDSVIYVDVDATGTGSGTNWADALTDLQDALFNAKWCPGADQIWVAGGTYKPTPGSDRSVSFELENGVAVYGGFAGVETARDQRDPGANPTVLSGNIGTPAATDNSYHVVTAISVDSTAVLDGFTVTGGYADGVSDRDGAGIDVEAAGPRVANVIFVDNHALEAGGGAQARGGVAGFFNCLFSGNSAETGGGLFGMDWTGRMVNCTFAANTASGEGGGMYMHNAVTLDVVNTIFWDNSAPSFPEIFVTPFVSVVTYSSCCLYDCGISGGGWNKDYGTDGGNNMDLDPLFVDEVSGDLRLSGVSPCEDGGDNSAPGLPAIDVIGAARIQDGTVDIGAYEGGVERATVTVTSEPHDFYLTVDGIGGYSPYSFETDLGAEHEIGIYQSPMVRSDTTFHFMGWSDGGDTTHTVTITGDPVTYTAYFSPLQEHAAIDSIVDVPADQGGWARVHFSRSMYDHAWETENPIERYNVHRRVDSPALAAVVVSKGKTVEQDVAFELWEGREMLLIPAGLAADTRYVEFEGRYFIVSGEGLQAAPSGVWEVVGDVSAQQENQYICLVSTLGDSLATIPWSVYYVSAHTTTPALFYDSEPDSGYSVDNIAPGVPQNLSVAYNTGSGNQLSWDASADEDFQCFQLYRGTDPEFIPGPGTEVHATIDLSWTDPDFDGWNVYYKVTALDHAGNESLPAEAGTTTGSETPEVPISYALYQNAPNPFNPSTMIRFDLPTAGLVRLAVYNVKGQLVSVLVDGQMAEGRREVRWNGMDLRGNRVASGMYFYRLTAAHFVMTKKMVLLR